MPLIGCFHRRRPSWCRSVINSLQCHKGFLLNHCSLRYNVLPLSMLLACIRSTTRQSEACNCMYPATFMVPSNHCFTKRLKRFRRLIDVVHKRNEVACQTLDYKVKCSLPPWHRIAVADLEGVQRVRSNPLLAQIMLFSCGISNDFV